MISCRASRHRVCDYQLYIVTAIDNDNNTCACVGGFNWDQPWSLVGPANTSIMLLFIVA